ncbi:MAG: hypothetical protein IH946_06180 [Bacteroidetes bacterium]|nr:hypothetical protein [Bacteroidota bacterium]
MTEDNLKTSVSLTEDIVTGLMESNIGRFIVWGGVLFLTLHLSGHFFRAAARAVNGYKEFRLAVAR